MRKSTKSHGLQTVVGVSEVMTLILTIMFSNLFLGNQFFVSFLVVNCQKMLVGSRDGPLIAQLFYIYIVFQLYRHFTDIYVT